MNCVHYDSFFIKKNTIKKNRILTISSFSSVDILQEKNATKRIKTYHQNSNSLNIVLRFIVFFSFRMKDTSNLNRASLKFQI